MNAPQRGATAPILRALIGMWIFSDSGLVLAADTTTADSGQSMFSLRGFGTLGVVHSSDDQADYVANGMQPKGAGFTDSWSATPDSKLGIQVSAQFTGRLSAVVQAVSQYQADGTYRPDVEWANIKFQVTPEFDVRAGRIVLPTFMYSDSTNVGYALPYVRIPLEIYGEFPVDSSDGIDGSYRFHVGDVTNSTQVYTGHFHSSTPHGGYYNLRDLYGIVDALEYEALTVHLSYQKLRYDLSVAGLVLGSDPQTLVNIGASYDPATWFVLGEWIRQVDDQSGLNHSWYVMSGLRFRKFTPYADHARADRSHAGTMGGPPILNQDTSTLGLRWDFISNFDCKLQFDHTTLHGGSNTFFVNQQPGFQEAGTVNVLSLAVDFIF
jgi:hypothetical protein